MQERNYIKDFLYKQNCYKCQKSLETAKLETITDAPLAIIAHAVCSNCKAESMVTLTASGGTITPLVTDLSATEFKKFMNAKSVSYNEVLELHQALKKKDIWNLLDKKDKSLVKKQRI